MFVSIRTKGITGKTCATPEVNLRPLKLQAEMMKPPPAFEEEASREKVLGILKFIEGHRKKAEEILNKL